MKCFILVNKHHYALIERVIGLGKNLNVPLY